MTAHARLLAAAVLCEAGSRVEPHEMHVRNGVAIPRAEMSKGLAVQSIIQSSRLRLSEFAMADAADVYHCITPAIAKYMFWEPPSSFAAYKARREETLRSANRNDFSFVIRRHDTMECLGIASLDGIDADAPELGVWLKESVHGNRYGSEVVRAVADWAAGTLGKERFTYAVAIENVPSRRIAEALGGEVVGTRTSPKYDSVVYRIAWPPGRPSRGDLT